MNNEDKILSMLETLTRGQAELRESQAVLEHEMGELKSAQFHTHMNQEKHSREQAVIQSDLKMVKQDVTSVKQDVASVKQDVASVKQDVASVKQDVKIVKTKVGKIDTNIKFIWEDIERQGSRITSHESAMHKYAK